MAVSKAMKLELNYQNNQQSLAKVKQELEHIFTASRVELSQPGVAFNEKEINRVKQAAQQLHTILSRSFDVELGVTNIAKFRAELEKSGTSLQSLYNDLRKVGPEGEKAFRDMAASIATSNIQLQKTDGFLNKMATTLMNTIRWTLATNVLNAITGTLSDAVTYVERLDTSLNNIRVVTGASADDMARFSKEANKAAQELGASTRDIAEGALIFYQQGDTDENAMYKAQVTQKLTNVSTDLNADEASEFMTAIWNGFQVNKRAALEGMQVYDEYADKLAAVAASTASNVTEQATAMAKVASAANLVGVGFDQLNAIMATTESVTRQAPETIGTAWRTIFSRMTDLKLGGVDEDGVSLGDVSGKLSGYGINILDETGELRELGKVIDEIGEKWGQWTKAQQVAVAELIAGKRQYNNVTALFQEWDTMYKTALETSETGVGKLQEMQDVYMESNAAIRQQFKTAGEELYSDLFDVDNINDVIKGATEIVKLIDGIIKSLGGAVPIFTAISGLLTQLVSQKVATGLGTILNNLQSSKLQLQNAKEALKMIQEMRQMNDVTPQIEEIFQYIEKFTTIQNYMNEEQQARLKFLVKEKKEVQDLTNDWNNLAQVQLNLAEHSGQSLTTKDLQLGTRSDNYTTWVQHLERDFDQIEELQNTIIPRIRYNIDQLPIDLSEAERRALSLQQIWNEIALIGEQPATSGWADWADWMNELAHSGYNAEIVLDQMQQQLERQHEDTTQWLQDLKKLSEDAETLKTRFDATADGAKNLGNQLKNALIIDPILKGISGLTEFTSAIMMSTNAFSTLTDAETGAAEKLQALISLGMAFGMAFKGLETIKNAGQFTLLDTFEKGYNTSKKKGENALANNEKITKQIKKHEEEIAKIDQTRQKLLDKLAVDNAKLRDLTKQQKDQKANILKLNTELEKKDKEIEQAQAHKIAIENKQESKAIDIRRAELLIERATNERLKIQEQLNDAKDEEVKTTEEIEEITDKIKSSEQASDFLDSLTDSQNEEIEKLGQELTGVTDVFDNLVAGFKALKGGNIILGLTGIGSVLITILATINEIIGANYEKIQKNVEDSRENLEKTQNDLANIESNLESLREERDKLLELQKEGNLTEAEKERLATIKEEIEQQKQQKVLLEEQEKIAKEIAAKAEIAATNAIQKTDLLKGGLASIKLLFIQIGKVGVATLDAILEHPLAAKLLLNDKISNKNTVEVVRTKIEVQEAQALYEATMASSSVGSDRDRFEVQRTRLQELENQRKDLEYKRDHTRNAALKKQYEEQLKIVENYYNSAYVEAEATYDKLKQAYEDSELLGNPDEALGVVLNAFDNFRTKSVDTIKKQEDAVNDLRDAWQDLSETTKEEFAQLLEDGKLTEEKINEYFGSILDVANISAEDRLELIRRIIKETNIEVEKSAEEAYATVKTLKGEISQTYDEFASRWGISGSSKEPFKGLTNSAKQYAEVLKTVKSNLNTVGDAIKEQNKNGTISAETAVSLVSINEEYANALEVTEKGIKLNTEALKEQLVYDLQSIDAKYEEIEVNKIKAQQALDNATSAKTNMVSKTAIANVGYGPFKKWLKDNAANLDITQDIAEIIGQGWAPEMATNSQAFETVFGGESLGGIGRDTQLWKNIIKGWQDYVKKQDEEQRKLLEDAVKEAQAAYDSIDTEGIAGKRSHLAALIKSIQNGTAFIGSDSETDSYKKEKIEKYRDLLGEDIDIIENEIKSAQEKNKRLNEKIANAIKQGDTDLVEKLTEEFDESTNNLNKLLAERAKRLRNVLTQVYADTLEELKNLDITLPEEVTDMESFFDYLPRIQGDAEAKYNAEEVRLENEMNAAQKAGNNELYRQLEDQLNQTKLKHEALTATLKDANELFDLVGTQEGEGSLAEEFEKNLQEVYDAWLKYYQQFKNDIKETIEDIDFEISILNDEMSSLEPTQYAEKLEIQGKILDANKRKAAELAKNQEKLNELYAQNKISLKQYNDETRTNTKEIQSANKTIRDNAKAMVDQAKAIRDAAIAQEQSARDAWDKAMQAQFDATEKQIDAEDRLLKKRKKAIDEAKKALQKYLEALERTWKAEDAHEERKKKLEERAEKAYDRATQLTAAASGDLAALANVRDLDKELKSMDEELQEDIITDIRDSFKQYIEDIQNRWDDLLDKEQKAIDLQKEQLEEDKRIWDEFKKTPAYWAGGATLAAGGTVNFNGKQMNLADLLGYIQTAEGKQGTIEGNKEIEDALKQQRALITDWYADNGEAITNIIINGMQGILGEDFGATQQALADNTAELTDVLQKLKKWFDTYNYAAWPSFIDYLDKNGVDTSDIAAVAAAFSKFNTGFTQATVDEGLGLLGANTNNTVLPVANAMQNMGLQIAGYDTTTPVNQGMAAALQSTDENVARIAEHVTNEDNKVTTVNVNVEKAVNVEGSIDKSNVGQVTNAAKDAAYSLADVFAKQFKSQGYTTVSQKH